jgi:hypothetical protein
MRTLRVFIFAALIIGLVTAPADAAQTFHSRLKGGTAYAEWYSSSGNTTQSGFIDVSDRYDELYFSQCTDEYDSTGDFVSATCTSGFTTDFTFTIDQRGLTSATVTATDVRARTCTYDADFNTTCERAKIDIDVTWTGRGSLSRGGYNERSIGDGYVFVSHFNGTWRRAIATGTIGEVTYTRDDLSYAQIGFARSGYVDVCLGADC